MNIGTTPPRIRRNTSSKAAPARTEFNSMGDAVKAVKELDFHPIDPFVASVASGVQALDLPEPSSRHREKVYLDATPYYGKKVPAELNLQHGPDAPMLLILPGVFGGLEGGNLSTVKKLALERNLNYAVLANPLNADMIDRDAKRHPGNMKTEAEATHLLLSRLKEKKPEYFDNVSIAGYSYGGLLAVNVAKIDESMKDSERLIQGGVLTISAPENLISSMKELDKLRDGYGFGSGSPELMGLMYSSEVAEHGYEDFESSGLWHRGPGYNHTEIKIVDEIGSRDNLKAMVEQVDIEFGHSKLPISFFFQRSRVLDNMTFEEYSEDWFSKDPWLAENNTTAEKLSEETSYSKAMDALKKTPVMTIVSADDYILNDEDLKKFEDLAEQKEELEHTEIFKNGGHLGLLFNPAVREFIGDFGHSSTHLKGAE